jgi:hypothetical protein
MTSSTFEDTLIYRVDRFVQSLEAEGKEFEVILDALLEYVDVCDDVFGK